MLDSRGLEMRLAADQPDAAEAAVRPPHGRRPWRRFAAASLAVAAAIGLTAAVVAARVPDFYRRRLAMEGAEASARRLVSDVSALHASIVREGTWEAAFDEDDVNGWLAFDLPRNHGRLLPAWMSAPRVRFEPRRVQVAMRVGHGVVSAVATVVAEVQLREPNQLGIVVEDARIGGLPVPRGPVLGELRRRCERFGMVTSLRRLEDRSLLVVYIPSTHEAGGPSHWLESLAVGDGTVAVAGQTRASRRAGAAAVSETGS